MRTEEEARQSLFVSEEKFVAECDAVDVEIQTLSKNASPIPMEIDGRMGSLMLYYMCLKAFRKHYPKLELPYVAAVQSLSQHPHNRDIQPSLPLLRQIEIPIHSDAFKPLEAVLVATDNAVRRANYPNVNQNDSWEWMQEVVLHVFKAAFVKYDTSLQKESFALYEEVDSILFSAITAENATPQTLHGYGRTPWIIIPDTNNPFAIVDLIHEVAHALHISIANHHNRPPFCEIDPLVGESVAQAFTLYALEQLTFSRILGPEMSYLIRQIFISKSANRFNSKQHFLSTILGHRLGTNLSIQPEPKIFEIMESGSAVKIEDLGAGGVNWFKYAVIEMSAHFSRLQMC